MLRKAQYVNDANFFNLLLCRNDDAIFAEDYVVFPARHSWNGSVVTVAWITAIVSVMTKAAATIEIA